MKRWVYLLGSLFLSLPLLFYFFSVFYGEVVHLASDLYFITCAFVLSWLSLLGLNLYAVRKGFSVIFIGVGFFIFGFSLAALLVFFSTLLSIAK